MVKTPDARLEGERKKERKKGAWCSRAMQIALRPTE